MSELLNFHRRFWCILEQKDNLINDIADTTWNVSLLKHFYKSKLSAFVRRWCSLYNLDIATNPAQS